MKIIFFGTPEFSVPFLQALINDKDIDVLAVVSQPDKPSGRGRNILPTPSKICAQANSLEVLQFDSLKSADVVDKLTSKNAYVYVVVAYGKIIPSSVLNIPPLGCVNIHPSLLPKYRGPSPIQTAILNGDEKTGVTVMKLDEGMDTGPILAQMEVSIEPEETGLSLSEKISSTGPAFLLKTLKEFATGTIVPVAQSDSDATVTKMFTRDDGRIDWTSSAVEIIRQIRALTPWPGGWTTLNGKIFKIHSAVVSATSFSSSPGVAHIVENRLFVQTGKDTIELKIVQQDGKPSITAQAFINGIKGRLVVFE